MAFTNPLTARIADFLKEIGIEVLPASLPEATFLPGIEVDRGRLLVDEAKLAFPGDLLHEAGHLALAPAEIRGSLSGEVDLPNVIMEQIESQAIAWSYAALMHLELPPEVLFHAGGYRGDSESLMLSFRIGVYIGANGLEELGMTATERTAGRLGVQAYPHMLKWMRD